MSKNELLLRQENAGDPINRMKMFWDKRVVFYYDPRRVLAKGLKIPHPDHTGYFKIIDWVEGGVSLEYVAELDKDLEDAGCCGFCHVLMAQGHMDEIEEMILDRLNLALADDIESELENLKSLSNDLRSGDGICKICLKKQYPIMIKDRDDAAGSNKEKI